MTTTLNKTEAIRVFKEIDEKITETMNQHPDKWENKSHFIRSAILHFIRSHKKTEANKK